MSTEWQHQLREFVNTIDKLKQYVNLTLEEENFLGTTENHLGHNSLFRCPDGP